MFWDAEHSQTVRADFDCDLMELDHSVYDPLEVALEVNILDFSPFWVSLTITALIDVGELRNGILSMLHDEVEDLLQVILVEPLGVDGLFEFLDLFVESIFGCHCLLRLLIVLLASQIVQTASQKSYMNAATAPAATPKTILFSEMVLLILSKKLMC